MASNAYKRTVWLAGIRIGANVIMLAAVCVAMYQSFLHPAEYLELPPSTWEAGDECRIYYKENAKHQALRFMNVSKTNIFKK